MLFINLVCDEDDCDVCQPAFFENEKETYGDLLQAFSDSGWNLTIENDKVVKSVCNKHK